MHELTEFLFPAPAERRTGAIWAWWEKRRLPYNVWVGTAGLFSVAVGTLLSLVPPTPLGPPPLHLLWQPVVMFAVLANVFYTSGAVLETFAEKLFGRQLLPIGPSLYRMGLTFSVGLALFPTLIMLLSWIFRIVTAVF
jgi:hypothetical protein